MTVAMAAPVAASAGRAAAGKVAGKKAAQGAAGKTAAKGAGGGAGSLSKGKGDLPGKGDWKTRATELGGAGGGGKSKSGGGSKALAGDAGKYRRMMIAEFLICVILLALSPLAKGPGEMGPIRFMKRGSATCAFFVVLGLVSSAGKGAARAAAMFGALVTLVLLVDQREAFGKLATTLNTTKDDDTADAASAAAGLGPDDSTATDDDPGVAQV